MILSLLFYGNIGALQEHMNASAAGMGSTVGESSPADRVQSKDKLEEIFEPLGLNLEQVPVESDSYQEQNIPFLRTEFHIENGIETAPNVEHQFISSFAGRSPVHQNNQENHHPESNSLSALRNGSGEEIFVSLQLGEPESKRRKHSNSPFNIDEPK